MFLRTKNWPLLIRYFLYVSELQEWAPVDELNKRWNLPFKRTFSLFNRKDVGLRYCQVAAPRSLSTSPKYNVFKTVSSVRWSGKNAVAVLRCCLHSVAVQEIGMLVWLQHISPGTPDTRNFPIVHCTDDTFPSCTGLDTDITARNTGQPS